MKKKVYCLLLGFVLLAVNINAVRATEIFQQTEAAEASTVENSGGSLYDDAELTEAEEPDEIENSELAEDPDEIKNSELAEDPDEIKSDEPAENPDEIKNSELAEDPDEIKSDEPAENPDEIENSELAEEPDEIENSEPVEAPSSEPAVTTTSPIEPPSVFNVIAPTSLDFTIDPLDLSERGQVYSDVYTIENHGETDALLIITDITCVFANGTDFEALSQPFDEDSSTGLKSIYMLMDFGRNDVEPVSITDPDLGEIPAIPLYAEGNGPSACFLSLMGSVNAYPDIAWHSGDVKIRFTYTLEPITAEEETEDATEVETQESEDQTPVETEARESESQTSVETEVQEPGHQTPVETEVQEPEDQTPVETEAQEPEDQTPMETEAQEPEDQTPVETEVQEPEDQTPMETEAQEPEDQTPVETEAQEPEDQTPVETEAQAPESGTSPELEI